MKVVQSTLKLLIPLILICVVFIPAVDASGNEVDSAYETLSAKEQNAYDDLYASVLELKDSREFKELTIAQGRMVEEALLCDHPELFWYRNSYSMYVYTDDNRCANFCYEGTYTKTDIAVMQGQLNAAVSKMTDLEGSEAEKVMTIHNWLCDNITYVEGSVHSNDIYGALVLGECVCEGYARGFDYLCDLNGINSLYLRGYTYTSSTVPHAWNIVNVDDSWYYLDVTWDDKVNSIGYDYFLVGSHTKVDGRMFASENHMADYDYGVVASESAYLYYYGMFSAAEWANLQIWIMILFGFGIFLVFNIVMYRRNRRIARSRNRYANVDSFGLYVEHERCPQCGSVKGEEYDFCPYCGFSYQERKP